MRVRCAFRRAIAGAVAAAALFNGAPAHARQREEAPQHQHEPPPAPAAPEARTEAPHPQHEHAEEMGSMMFAPREGSGTAWLPDTTPMYAVHGRAGQWEIMGHGNAFVQFLDETGNRGSRQFGSINWMMGMARRPLAGGRLGVRGMLSLEPWTIRGCGYPDLLATGESCGGSPIRDRQHPHDLFMEVAAEYDRPLRDDVRWQVYGGIAGEPALGPVAYPHRLSALPNPLAPIAHHWLDATHITFGVVTGGLYGQRWKAEGSIFNGREPDEERADFDFEALDSFSGRLWFLPTARLALQISAGHLREAEAAEGIGPRIDVDRVTASATYHRALGERSLWASTLAWGMNREEGESTNVILAETNLTLQERHTWFGRLELAGKPAHDLGAHDTEDVLTIAKLQAGYTRYLASWHGLTPGIGGSVSAGVVPGSLEHAYGSRVNVGFGLFVTVRPGAAHGM